MCGGGGSGGGSGVVGGKEGRLMRSKHNIVDLAGSERWNVKSEMKVGSRKKQKKTEKAGKTGKTKLPGGGDGGKVDAIQT